MDQPGQLDQIDQPNQIDQSTPAGVLLMSLRGRLLLFSLALLIPTGLSVVWFATNSTHLIADAESVGTDDIHGALLTLELLDELGDMQSNVGDYLSGETHETADFEANRVEFEAFFAELEPLETLDSEIVRLARIRELTDYFIAETERNIFSKYSADDEVAALAEADALENEEGVALRRAINQLAEKIHSDDRMEPSTANFALKELVQLQFLAADMVTAVSEYAAGEPEERDLFYQANIEFADHLASLVPVIDDTMHADLSSLQRRSSDFAEHASSGVFVAFDPALKQAAITTADELEHSALAELETLLIESTDEERADAQEQIDSLTADVSSMRTMLIIGQAVAGLGTAALFLAIGRSIANSVERVATYAHEVSSGNWSTPLPQARSAEIRRLNQSLTTMVGQLNEQRQGVEAASRAKSTFLANMSHEIRSPMNVILGYLEQLRSDQDLSSTARDHVSVIGHSANDLLALINDVLDVSRIESGQLAFDPSTFDVRDSVAIVADLFTRQAKDKSIEISTRVHEHVPAEVTTDRRKLNQILINVLGNAVKFTDRGLIGIEVMSSAHQITIRIDDSACGVDPVDVPKLFTRFEQGKAGQQAGGTGLGLAISKELAELIGGTLRYVDKRGPGARFELEFPIGATDALVHSTEPRSTRPPSIASDGLVLVADDRAENRQLLRLILSNRGNLKIAEANNGAEAVQFCTNQMPDVVFMDIHMPVLEGLSAIAKIRQLPKGESTRIIVVSASTLQHDIEQAARAGADAFVSKPIQSDDIWDQITVQTDHGEQVSTEVAGLSEDQRSLLAEAVESLSVERINNALNLLAERGAGVEALRQLAHDFRYDEVFDQLKGKVDS